MKIVRRQGEGMNINMKQNLWKQMGIGAVLPGYDSRGGNIVIVYLLNGEREITYKTVRSFITVVVREYGIDLYQTRKKYGEVLQRKQEIPIPITEDMTFLSVKVRTPVGKYDGGNGYILLEAIHNVEERERKALITLVTGEKIQTLVSKRCLDTKIVQARLVQELYEKDQKNLKEILRKMRENRENKENEW